MTALPGFRLFAVVCFLETVIRVGSVHILQFPFSSILDLFLLMVSPAKAIF